MRKLFKSAISALLCLSMTLACACGNSVPTETTGEISETEISQSEMPSVSLETSEPETTAEIIEIDDFFNYANEAWLNDNYIADYETCNLRYYDEDNALFDKLETIMKDLSPESFSEDDPMHKVLLYAEQSAEEGRCEEAMAEIKSMTDYIASVKSFNQFINLMSDETYCLFNNICSVKFLPNVNGDMHPMFYASPLFGMFSDLTEDEREYMESGYAEMLKLLGYSEEEAARISHNAGCLDELIHVYLNNQSGGYEGYSEYRWNNTECSIDLLELQAKLGYLMTLDNGELSSGIWATPEYIEWLNAVVAPDNLEMLKDFYIVSLIDRLVLCGSPEFITAYGSIFSRMCGAETIDEYELDDFFYLIPVASYDDGALSNYLAKQVITDRQRNIASEMAEKIIAAYREMIKETSWLDMDQKNRINTKLKKMKFLWGEFEEYPLLEDFVIEDSFVRSTISLLNCNRRFDARCLVEGTEYVPTTYNMFSTNAFFIEDADTVLFTPGQFANEELWNITTYERLLGMFGCIIAHEIGHSIDPARVGEKADGTYDDNWDKFAEKYYEEADKIYYYYDGLETEFGNHINGSVLMTESYADIVSMQVMLKLLESMGDVRYDDFFTGFANYRAALLRPEYESYLIRQDNHATPRERINGTLAQFDKFYEVYSVSEDSYYYVKPEDRIRLFVSE